MDPEYFSVRLAPRSETKPALIQLTQTGDVLGVQKLLRGLGVAEAVDEVMRTVDGDKAMRTSLHYAAFTGNAAMQQQLLYVPRELLRKRMQQQLRELKQRGADMARFGTAGDIQIFEEWALTERARLRREMELELDRKHNELLALHDRRHISPLSYAAAAGGSLDTLLRSGRGNLRTPAKLERWEKVLYEGEGAVALLRAEQDRVDVINAQDVHGFTALHFASACGNVRAIKQLLDCGADRSVESAQGETALDVASSSLTRRALTGVLAAVTRSGTASAPRTPARAAAPQGPEKGTRCGTGVAVEQKVIAEDVVSAELQVKSSPVVCLCVSPRRHAHVQLTRRYPPLPLSLYDSGTRSVRWRRK